MLGARWDTANKTRYVPDGESGTGVLVCSGLCRDHSSGLAQTLCEATGVRYGCPSVHWIYDHSNDVVRLSDHCVNAKRGGSVSGMLILSECNSFPARTRLLTLHWLLMT